MGEIQTSERLPGAVYSTKQISLATFLGSPLAGCWFLSLNYRRFNQPRNALFSIIGGVLSTIGLLATTLILPPWFPNIILPVACALAMRGIAEGLQGNLLADHAGAGGRIASWWIVVGISLLIVGILFGILFGALWLFPNLIPA